MDLTKRYLILTTYAGHMLTDSHNHFIQTISTSIFLYMLKLLQSKSHEVLVFNWAKILAIYGASTCAYIGSEGAPLQRRMLTFYMHTHTRKYYKGVLLPGL